MNQSSNSDNWIEEAIKKDQIKYYEYNQFKDIKKICFDGFGQVYRANWKNTVLSLKTFEYENVKEITNEVNILRNFDFHENIIRFLGITDENDNSHSQNKKYMMVIEYTDEGSLKNYLKNNFSNLTWEDKYQLAYQIAMALECLHNEGILHHDLNSNNILVHRHRIKLANFGLSGRIGESSKITRGVIPYVDPNGLNQYYQFNEKSDIYSLGVLFWEISSGQPPFKNTNYDVSLSVKIVQGLRETDVKDTPLEYIQLYTECWDDKPDKRPTIQQIIIKLKSIMLKENIITTDGSQNNDCEEYKINSIPIVVNTSVDNLSQETSQMIKNISEFESMIKVVEPGAIKIVLRAKFLPFISEIEKIFNEISDITEAAEYNIRICNALKLRVYAAKLVAEINLKIKINQDFFNDKNFLCLQNLVNAIARIKIFAIRISQMKTLLKYIQEESIEELFKKLCKVFDISINLLPFTINIKDIICVNEEAELKADQEDLNKYIEGMGADFISKKFPSMGLKVSTMHNTMMELKTNEIFKVHQLNFANCEIDKKSYRGRRVSKWINVENKEEFALKNLMGIDGFDKDIIQNHVTILKELHDFQNIIKFYGLTCVNDALHLVTEWVEYGNLREFYTNHKSRFDLRLKLSIALDIARGLSFLRTVEIMHRDIRAENILITRHETAKLTNFRHSERKRWDPLPPPDSEERVRYSAPELLARTPKSKYNQKCEVYSFGVLLWEIAEERIPYQDIDVVLNPMYRETFSENSQMSEKFKQLEAEAVCHEPDLRPKITTMVIVLNDCFKEFLKGLSYTSSSDIDRNKRSTQPKPTPKRAHDIDQDAPINLPDLGSFKYMTLDEAAKQHKLVSKSGSKLGDINTAYKCFDAYANISNQIRAKYYKAYYISKGFVESNMSSEEKNKVAAELFKEAADDEISEFPEAKVRYGDHLYYGKGVEQNFLESLEYFEKASEEGYYLKVAMYNTGNLYYNGIAGKKDMEKALHYIKLCAYGNYEASIKFCKDRGIIL